MGCDYTFTNLRSKQTSDTTCKNTFRYIDNSNIEQFKDLFKEIISKENWRIDDPILCNCCCSKIYFCDNYLYNLYENVGETNELINFFINLNKVNEEFEQTQLQKQFTEFCFLCNSKVSKLYVTKSGLKVCEKC